MKSKRKFMLSVAGFLLAFVVGIFMFVDNNNSPDLLVHAEEADKLLLRNEENTSESTSSNLEEISLITTVMEFPVYLTGEVNEPGVYIMQAGDYLYELIEQAGGFTDIAATDSVNLAVKLDPENHIRILSIEEYAERELDIMSSATHINGNENEINNGLININTANKSELMTLTGIGDAYAQRIIDYREANGLFENIEDLMQVNGIKNNKFDSIKDQITVG